MIWTFPAPGAAETAKAPKELVQYIRDARKLGLKDTAIKENAVKAGWNSATVDGALADARSASQEPAVKPDAEAVPPQSVPSGAETPAAATEPLPKPRGVPDDYKIGAGDVLQILVWKEPDASVNSVEVRPDGKIAIPLLKEVYVMDMTPPQAEQLITQGLSKFIHGVDVTVVVKEIHSKKFYLIGAVKKEGPVELRYRMTVLQALSEAGGLTEYAKKKKIYILRTDSGKQYRLPFNYDAVIKGENMEQNVWVMPNDVIVVPH